MEDQRRWKPCRDYRTAVQVADGRAQDDAADSLSEDRKALYINLNYIEYYNTFSLLISIFMI